MFEGLAFRGASKKGLAIREFKKRKRKVLFLDGQKFGSAKREKRSLCFCFREGLLRALSSC